MKGNKTVYILFASVVFVLGIGICVVLNLADKSDKLLLNIIFTPSNWESDRSDYSVKIYENRKMTIKDREMTLSKSDYREIKKYADYIAKADFNNGEDRERWIDVPYVSLNYHGEKYVYYSIGERMELIDGWEQFEKLVEKVIELSPIGIDYM